MKRQFLAACLFLAIVAEQIEARSAYYKRNSHHDAAQRTFPVGKRQSDKCTDNLFYCEGRDRCIRQSWVCDDYDDCGDESDEKPPGGCLARECPENYVKCSNGQCIEKSAYCAGERQCTLQNATVISAVECPRAECGRGQVHCPVITRCIDKTSICDTYNNCQDNSDEQNCHDRVCEENEFQCNSGQCIDQFFQCTERYTDFPRSPCRDGTDATGACLNYKCPQDYFKCKSDGRCIFNAAICDGSFHCADGSDELVSLCPPIQCEAGFARCANHNICIRTTQFCDTRTDCIDKSDESSELCSDRVCEEDEIRCASGQCVTTSKFCISPYSQYSSTPCEDQKNVTGVCLNFVCPEDHFKCHSDGVCIQNVYRCNGFENCLDGSDEADSTCEPFECQLNHAKCPSRYLCIDSSKFCDGRNDCGDYEDESPELCINRQCGEGELKCANGQCLNRERFCRSEIYCVDSSFSAFNPAVCAPPICQPGYAICPTFNKCILTTRFCDEWHDCNDDSDESPEFCKNRQCEEDEVRCASGQCLNREKFCRAEYDCRNNTPSSADPAICTPVQCEPGFDRCPGQNKCIERSFFCNFRYDCGDFSDETSWEFCNNRQCEEDEVRCGNGQCLNRERFCRGEYGCADYTLSSTDPNVCP